MNSMQSIILVGALVALLGATGSEALFGKKKHQQPTQVITNYVPINQGQPAHYGAEHAYYPTEHHHGGHHVAHHGAGHHSAGHHGAGHHAGGGASAATASASAGGAASASASAASAPAAYYEEPHHHHVEHHYEPAEYYPAEPHHGHHAHHAHLNACVAPPCYGGLVQNFGVPAPKRQGLVSKLLHKGGHRGSHGSHGSHGAHEAHGQHGGYAAQYY